jgi:Holliday junction resolvase RusA-like endonuclease
VTRPDPDVVIRLDGEPQGKGRGRATTWSAGNKRRIAIVTPEKTRTYETNLKYAAQQEMNGRAPYTGYIALTVHAFRSIPQSFSKKKHAAALAGVLRPDVKPDYDNIIKTLDALNQVVWVDDKQVVDAHILKFYSDRPRLVITVWQLDEIDIHQELRARNGLPPVDDPLPGEPPNVFQIVKGVLFP